MNLKIERIKRGLKQTDVAEATGISTGRISMIENGSKPIDEAFSYRELLSLAKLFNMTIEDLVNEE